MRRGRRVVLMLDCWLMVSGLVSEERDGERWILRFGLGMDGFDDIYLRPPSP